MAPYLNLGLIAAMLASLVCWALLLIVFRCVLSERPLEPMLHISIAITAILAGTGIVDVYQNPFTLVAQGPVVLKALFVFEILAIIFVVVVTVAGVRRIISTD